MKIRSSTQGPIELMVPKVQSRVEYNDVSHFVDGESLGHVTL